MMKEVLEVVYILYEIILKDAIVKFDLWTFFSASILSTSHLKTLSFFKLLENIDA